MKKALFVLMLAAAAFVGCQKQETAAPAAPAATTAPAQGDQTAAPAVAPAAPASK